jgi:hypothetical protein
MATQASQVPGKAWAVVWAGVIVNLTLGILYAWSVWKGVLVNKAEADLGHTMTGLNAGWPISRTRKGQPPIR